MIKAISHNDKGKKALILGLSKKNWEKLMENMPIAFPASAVGLTEVEVIIIVGGETEETITEELAKHFYMPKGTDA